MSPADGGSHNVYVCTDIYSHEWTSMLCCCGGEQCEDDDALGVCGSTGWSWVLLTAACVYIWSCVYAYICVAPFVSCVHVAC